MYEQSLAEPGDIVYLYDGSLYGFYCCVFESVYKKELPWDISPEDSFEPCLYSQKYIETDDEKSLKVRNSISKKISPDALTLSETVFLSCLENKEICILKFLLMGYKTGSKIMNMIAHPIVAPLFHAERHLLGEAHLLKGFLRFSDYGGALAATITPKNFILPFLENHFISRYNNENFMIFDKTHKAALIYHNKKSEIISADSIDFPDTSADEEYFRKLWKHFYNTIAIEGRENPKCRMTHMPKRYWENMTEFQ